MERANLLLNVATAGNAFAIFFFGAIQTMIPRKNAVHYWMMAMFMIASINIGADVFHRTELYRLFPHTLYVTYPLEYAMGPIIFFFLSTLLDDDFHFQKRHILLFSVPVAVALLLTPYFFLSDQEKLLYHPIPLFPNRWLGGVYYVIDFGIEIWTGFCIFIFLIGASYSFRLGNTVWKKQIRFVLYYGFAGVLWLALYAVVIISETESLKPFFSFLATLLFLVFSWYYIRNPEIFFLIGDVIKNTPVSRSVLGSMNLSEVMENLNRVMERDRIYLEDDLTLKGLSEELSIRPHQLSEILNTKLNVSFTNYINGYRIHFARQLLKDAKGYSILEVAYASGFRSKSTFNYAFKIHTGMTPREYRNSLLLEE